MRNSISTLPTRNPRTRTNLEIFLSSFRCIRKLITNGLHEGTRAEWRKILTSGTGMRRLDERTQPQHFRIMMDAFIMLQKHGFQVREFEVAHNVYKLKNQYRTICCSFKILLAKDVEDNGFEEVCIKIAARVMVREYVENRHCDQSIMTELKLIWKTELPDQLASILAKFKNDDEAVESCFRDDHAKAH